MTEGRGGRGRGRGRSRRGRGRGRWNAREDTPPSEPDISGKSDSETDFEMNDEEELDAKCDELFGCSNCHWNPEGCEECMVSAPVMQRPQNIRWKPEKGRPQKVPFSFHLPFSSCDRFCKSKCFISCYLFILRQDKWYQDFDAFMQSQIVASRLKITECCRRLSCQCRIFSHRRILIVDLKTDFCCLDFPPTRLP